MAGTVQASPAAGSLRVLPGSVRCGYDEEPDVGYGLPSAMSHSPSSHDHAAHHHHPAARGTALLWSLALVLGYAAVEAGAGWMAGSMALLGDAGHMLTDGAALGLAALVARLSRRPPSLLHSYGLARMEVLAAAFNTLLMLGVVAAIAVGAVLRLLHPEPVDGPVVIAVAAFGLLLNLVVAWVLARDAHSFNQRAALLHVLGDLLGSLAAVVAGVIVTFTGWMPIDPILSLFIGAIILFSSLRLLRETVHVLMEGTPLNLDLREIGEAMAGVGGVLSVHDLHVWTISSESVALSGHLLVQDLRQWPQVLAAERALLDGRFGIRHITLQPETDVQPLRRWPQAPAVPGDGHGTAASA